MKLFPKIFFIFSGIALILDSILMFMGKETVPVLGFPLPCPIALITLGIGLVSFALTAEG